MTLRHLSPAGLLDAAIEQNLVPDNYFTAWDLLCDWQMRTLKQLGMQPKSFLLDIGCGAMRLGLAAADYLESGRYFGVDPFEGYIRLAHDLAKREKVQKEYRIECNGDFGFSQLGARFDFAMAQSVLTHLSLKQIELCFKNLQPVMKNNGKFVFTYILGDYPTLGFLYAGTQVMQRGWLLDEKIFEEMAHTYGARFSKLPNDHPTGQLVGLFTYPG
jgi:cyclopropane fatty-acyl-phospholipid synthase-like methyltransferase